MQECLRNFRNSRPLADRELCGSDWLVIYNACCHENNEHSSNKHDQNVAIEDSISSILEECLVNLRTLEVRKRAAAGDSLIVIF